MTTSDIETEQPVEKMEDSSDLVEETGQETHAALSEKPATSTPEQRMAELEEQLAKAKERILREMADAENARRRAQKDKEDVSKYAISAFAKELLGVSDNFRRALEAVPGEGLDPAMKNLIVGIDATERQLLATLERFGIKPMDPLGKPYDPNFHRVMTEVEGTDKRPGTVVQVLQQGYTIHGRLLREALVAVAKGGEADAPHLDTSA
ncbi:MAG: nucleotide exchange factor GrpE [Alphaproteobacteria bacterium]|nr:nucleotide exchange factor GrpE [Alphaproteobacteria bacterium]